MELREYLIIIRKGLPFILIFTAVFSGIVSLFIAVGKPKYDSNVTLTIDRRSVTDQKSVSYYLYDDYYTLQSSGLLADTVINWMQSPSVVQNIYENANIPVPAVRNVAQLSKIFTVRKAPPATVSITIRTEDERQGKALLESATTELQKLTADLSQQQNEGQIVLHPTSTAVDLAKPFWALDLAISIMISLLLSIFMVFIREYIRPIKGALS